MDTTTIEKALTILLGEIHELRAENIEFRATIDAIKETQDRKSKFPAYLRIPKKGEKCPVTQLTRSTIYRLIKSNQIRTITAHPTPNSKRPPRLIVGASFEAYLLRQQKIIP